MGAPLISSYLMPNTEHSVQPKVLRCGSGKNTDRFPKREAKVQASRGVKRHAPPGIFFYSVMIRVRWIAISFVMRQRHTCQPPPPPDPRMSTAPTPPLPRPPGPTNCLRTLYDVLHDVHGIKMSFHHCNDELSQKLYNE